MQIPTSRKFAKGMMSSLSKETHSHGVRDAGGSAMSQAAVVRVAGVMAGQLSEAGKTLRMMSQRTKDSGAATKLKGMADRAEGLSERLRRPDVSEGELQEAKKQTAVMNAELLAMRRVAAELPDDEDELFERALSQLDLVKETHSHGVRDEQRGSGAGVPVQMIAPAAATQATSAADEVGMGKAAKGLREAAR